MTVLVHTQRHNTYINSSNSYFLGGDSTRVTRVDSTRNDTTRLGHPYRTTLLIDASRYKVDYTYGLRGGETADSKSSVA